MKTNLETRFPRGKAEVVAGAVPASRQVAFYTSVRPEMQLSREESADLARCERTMYAGPGWGWSPNPARGKPWKRLLDIDMSRANRRIDHIMPLEKALRRFKHRL